MIVLYSSALLKVACDAGSTLSRSNELPVRVRSFVGMIDS